jgi:hypothetical protein
MTPDELPDPASPSVLPADGATGAPSVAADRRDVRSPLPMKRPEVLSEHARFMGYDNSTSEKLRYARSATGWCLVIFAIATILPSIFYGRRGGLWISRATILCAVCFVVNLLVYRRYTMSLRKLASLEYALNHSSHPTPASVTPDAGQSPR